MPRPRGSFRGSRTQRRRKGWEEGPGGVIGTQFNATSAAILGAGATVLIDGLTLLRTRGVFEAVFSSTNVAQAGFVGALGIGIVNVTAFGVGATAVMLPQADADWDGWLYHRFFSMHAGDQTAGDIQDPRVEFEVDSRAMRKLKEDDVIYCACEVTEVGAADIDVYFDSRMLIALA